MLGRLVAKLLFKACVPLVALAGISSYGVYLSGGDPASLLRQVGSGAFGKATDGLASARDSAVGLKDQLGEKVSGSGVMTERASSDQVFTWKDADGVTHFATSAPVGVDARSMRVDPNVNVLAPVSSPAVAENPHNVPQSQPAAIGAAYADQSAQRAELIERLSGNRLTPASRE